jgi:hypothetical protein
LLQLGSERELNFKDDAFKTAVSKAPRTSSSKSSSSKSRSSSDAAGRAAKIKAAAIIQNTRNLTNADLNWLTSALTK